MATRFSILGLENPMARGAWWASPWGHKKSDTPEVTYRAQQLLSNHSISECGLRCIVYIISYHLQSSCHREQSQDMFSPVRIAGYSTHCIEKN